MSDLDELAAFRRELVACLVRYGARTEDDARALVDASRICVVADDEDRAALFHETPYYWAMSLLHARARPRWFDDRALWPPPADYEAWSARFAREE